MMTGLVTRRSPLVKCYASKDVARLNGGQRVQSQFPMCFVAASAQSGACAAAVLVGKVVYPALRLQPIESALEQSS
jgi:hypothetical protein